MDYYTLVCEMFRCNREQYDALVALDKARKETADDEYEFHHGCQFEFVQWGYITGVVVSTDETAEVGVLADLLHQWLKENFPADAALHFSWASTGSREAAGVYGGGSVLITTEGWQSMSEYDILDALAKDMGFDGPYYERSITND